MGNIIDRMLSLDRMLSHFRRDLHKVIDDIDIQLVLLKKKLSLYERMNELILVEKAQKYCEVKKADILYQQLHTLLKFYGIDGPQVHLSHRFPSEFEPFLHHLYTLAEELSVYSVNSVVKRSETEIETAFNELKRELQQAKRIEDGATLISMINSLLQELTQFEDFLLEDAFSKSDEPQVIQQCVALARKIDTLERLIASHFPALDDCRQGIINHWNQIVEVLIHAFDKVYAGKTVPITMRSGVQEFAVQDL